jgi:hypothetical protein
LRFAPRCGRSLWTSKPHTFLASNQLNLADHKTIVKRNTYVRRKPLLIDGTILPSAISVMHRQSARNPTTIRSRRQVTDKHKPVEPITAFNTPSFDGVCRQLGSYVWNNYLHAFTASRARSVSVFLWSVHSLATLSVFESVALPDESRYLSTVVPGSIIPQTRNGDAPVHGRGYNQSSLCVEWKRVPSCESQKQRSTTQNLVVKQSIGHPI